MSLNPRQLEAFRKVMSTGSMTLAAELLEISQPAVSRLIRDLETALSIRLFRREGNRLIPGAEARRLFREVERFYQGMESIERVALDLKAARVGNLRVATISALGLGFMSEGIQAFSQAHPKVSVSMDVCPSQDVLELVTANQVDVGYIGFMGTEYPGVDAFQQASVAAVCVLPRGHVLARRKAVRITDLHDQPLISLHSNSPLRLRVDMAMASAGVRCRHVMETTFAHSACSLVASGLGITISDPFTATQLRDPRIVCRPLVPDIYYTFSMVLPSHQPRSKVVNDFIGAMKVLFDKNFPASDS
ncbi:LysR substrate-binding domain-containing protein [Bordetella muralis]|uniref:LysR substrate-binding domain-containing protein n=1 Tax=Bordetella muralis TaxID=1649130 RepID=UPI0039F0457F